MKSFFIILILSLPLCTLAQNRLNIFITSDNGNQKLQHSTVKIEGNNFKIEAQSNPEGLATAKLPSNGKYFISISSLGYNKIDTTVTINRPEENLYVKMVRTKLNIDTINVAGTRKFMQVKRGNIILNIENNPLMNSSNLWEMLKQAPTVQAVETGALTVKSQSTTVFIDGRRIYLSGTDLMEYLRSIPSNNIDKVEIIANPNSTYASDISTVINIKSKNLKQEGYKVNVGTTLTKAKYFKNSSAVRMDFKKSSFNGQVGYIFDKGKRYENLEVTTQQKHGLQWDVNQYTDRANTGHKLYANIGYDINKNSKLTVYSEFKPNQTSSLVNSDNGSPTEERFTARDSIFHFRSIGNGSTRSAFIQGTYDLSWDSTNQNLKLQLEYATNRHKLNNTRIITNFYPNNQNKSFSYLDSLPNELKTFVASASYSKKILGGNLITGFRLFRNDLTNYNRTSQLINNASNTLSRSAFEYRENVYTIYSEWDAEINKFYYRIGVKLENNRIHSQEMVLNLENDINWFNILPSVLLQWDQNDNNTWNISYKNTFTRPDYYQLNPFERFTDNSSVNFKGNQAIKPQNNHTVDISWTNNGILSASLGGQYLKNFISTIILPNEEGILFQQYDNFDGHIYYGNVNLNLAPKKWWQLIATSNITYAYGNYNKVSRAAVSPLFDCRITNSFKLKNDWIFQLSQYYTSAMSDGYFKSLSTNNTSLALQKKLLKPGITLTATVNDLFKNELDRSRALYGGVLYHTKQYNDTRFFRFSVSWNFGMQKIKTSSKKESESDEAINRIK